MCKDNQNNRLVRLITKNGETNGRFHNVFTESFKINENSKVALVNVSADIDTRSIVLDSNNNNFTFKVRSLGRTNNVALTTGKYNLPSLREELTTKMNSALAIADQGAGTKRDTSDALDRQSFQWTPTFNPEDETLLTFTVGGKNSANFPTDNIENMTVSNSGKTYTSTSNNDWKNFAYSDDYFVNGCGIARCKLTNSPDPNNVDACFGLISEKPTTDTLQPSDYDYAFVHGDSSSSNYSVWIGGTEYDTGTAVNSNYILHIALDEGSLKFYADGTMIYGPVEFDFNVGYHLACSAFQLNDRIDDFTYCRDKLKTQNPLTGVVSLDESLTTEYSGDTSLVGTTPTAGLITVNLPEETRRLLGYSKNTLTKTATKHTFQGHYDIKHTTLPKNVAIYLEEAILNSMDGLTGRRDNLLYVVPSNSLDDDYKLNFTVPHPVFVSFKNKFPSTVNRLGVRMIESETQAELPIEYNGASITLLIVDEESS